MKNNKEKNIGTSGNKPQVNYNAIINRVRSYINYKYGLDKVFFVDDWDVINRAVEYVIKLLGERVQTVTDGEFTALLMCVANWRAIDAIRAAKASPIVRSTDEPIHDADGNTVSFEDSGLMALKVNFKDIVGYGYGTRPPCCPTREMVVDELKRIVRKCLGRKGISKAKQDAFLDAFFEDLSSAERAIAHGLTVANINVSKCRNLKYLKSCCHEFANSPILIERFAFLADEKWLEKAA